MHDLLMDIVFPMVFPDTLLSSADHVALTLQEALDKGLWTENELFTKRWPIFESLMAEGYYVMDGSKFGGDFLVYPGNLYYC
jgi:tRNA splicing endonuclease